MTIKNDGSFVELNKKVIACTRCPRLVQYRENVPARAFFKDEPYWHKPVPGYGDPGASLLILGLAPAAHGANRTGRVFTGDESAKFLIKAMHEAGLSNQAYSSSIDDGLILRKCYMTAVVKCVPPNNLPLKEEVANCTEYFKREFFLLKNLNSILALGKIAFDSYLNFLIEQKAIKKNPIFSWQAIKFDWLAHSLWKLPS